MKRTKLFLSTIVGVLLAFIMVFAVACNDGNGDNGGASEGTPNVRPVTPPTEKDADDLGITAGDKNENLSLLGITISTQGKTQFNQGDAYTPDTLAIQAIYLDSSIEPDPLDPDANLKYEVLKAEDYEIDSTDFNSSRVGVYTIYVSYEYLGVTCNVSYNVTVAASLPEYGGIIVEQVGENTYDLTGEDVEIPSDIVAVYTVGADGSKSEEPISSDLYTVELYLGSQKMEGNKADQNGVYSLVVTLKSDTTKQDFIPVYVVNAVTGIELDTAAGGVFSQGKSTKDKISGTWKFILTYANGSHKTISATAAGVEIDINTNTIGENLEAEVTYTEKDASGEAHTVTCKVTYTITEPTTTVYESVTANISTLVSAGTLTEGASYTESKVLATGDLGSVTMVAAPQDGDKKLNVDVDANKKSADGYSFTHRLKLGGAGYDTGRSIKLELNDAAIVTVYMMSSNSADAREVGLWMGTFDPALDEPTIATQTVGGASLEKYEYEIPGAGTYYLAAVSGGTNVYAIIISSEGGDSADSEGEGFTINVGELQAAGTLTGTISSNVEIANEDLGKVTVLATTDNTVAVDSSGKSADGIDFTHRLKLSGAGSDTARSIKFELNAGAKITVYGCSSSATEGSGDRTLGIYQGVKAEGEANTWAAVGATQDIAAGSSVLKLEFEVSAAGTYYFAAVSGGFNVYGIVITPNA